MMKDATIHPYNNSEKSMKLGPVSYGKWFLDHSANNRKNYMEFTWIPRFTRMSIIPSEPQKIPTCHYACLMVVY